MPQDRSSAPILAAAAPPRRKASNYPEPFATCMSKREKRPLGDIFGLTKFGVNLTTLAPGAGSALLHAHSRQDEFVCILDGAPTLVTEEGECELATGMCVGFPAGGVARQLVNRARGVVRYVEIGDRTPGDAVRLYCRRHRGCAGPGPQLGLRAQERRPLLKEDQPYARTPARMRVL